MEKREVVLTQRDLSLFEVVGKFGWLREDFVAEYLGLTYWEQRGYVLIKKITNRLVAGEWLRKTKLLGSNPCYVGLSKKTSGMMGTKYQEHKTLVTINHDDMAADLFMFYRDLKPTATLMTELELKHDDWVNGRPTNQSGRKQVKKYPDLIVDHLGEVLAVEVEISEKSKSRLQAIIYSYTKQFDDEKMFGDIGMKAKFKRVSYFSNQKRILNNVYGALKNPFHREKFSFYLFEDKNIRKAVVFNP